MFRARPLHLFWVVLVIGAVVAWHWWSQKQALNSALAAAPVSNYNF